MGNRDNITQYANKSNGYCNYEHILFSHLDVDFITIMASDRCSLLSYSVHVWKKYSYVTYALYIIDKGFTVGAVLVVLFILSMVSIYYMQNHSVKKPNSEGFLPLPTEEEIEEK